jgi:hypothetical protein
MKICRKCSIFYREQTMACEHCRGVLDEVSLTEALQLTQQESFRHHISGEDKRKLPDAHRQYHIRSYLANRSLFLDFDLHKNRLKHGKRLKRFFIAPVNITATINLPWFVFNVISSNLFHMQYTEYCPRCEAKYIKDHHNEEECDYNIEYFNILDDIINGRIVGRKVIYEEFAGKKRKLGLKSAYHDLFQRDAYAEYLLDFISVGLSVLFWIYIVVYVGLPFVKTFFQRMEESETYERMILILR